MCVPTTLPLPSIYTNQNTDSNQFGITIPEGGDDEEEAPTPAPKPTKDSYDSYPTSTPVKTSAAQVTTSATEEEEEEDEKTSTLASHVTTEIGTTVTTSYVASTGVSAPNSSIVQPSESPSVPLSLIPTTTNGTLSPPISTGAASQLQAGLGLAAGAVGLFFML